MKAIAWIVSIIAVFVFIAILGCYTVVPPGHRGVSVTLGKVDPQMRGEGLAFKKPFIQKIVKVPIQQITAGNKTPCFSSDLQLVEIAYYILYRLPENKVVELYQQYKGDPLTALVLPRLNHYLKLIVSGHRAEEIVKNRDSIRADTLEMMRTELAGLVDIRDLTIENIDLSDDLEKAIETKQVKEQEALAKTYDLQKAKKDAEIVLVEATAQAEAIRIKGEALKSSPEMIDLEIVRRWNGVSPVTVVTSEGGASILLPLK